MISKRFRDGHSAFSTRHPVRLHYWHSQFQSDFLLPNDWTYFALMKFDTPETESARNNVQQHGWVDSNADLRYSGL